MSCVSWCFVKQNRSGDGDICGVVSNREGQRFLCAQNYLHLKDKWKLQFSLYILAESSPMLQILGQSILSNWNDT